MGIGGNGIRRAELRRAGAALEVAAASLWESEIDARDSGGVRGSICEFDFSAAAGRIVAELPAVEFRGDHARKGIWVGGRRAISGPGDRYGVAGRGIAAGGPAPTFPKGRGHAGHCDAGAAGDCGGGDLFSGSEAGAESRFRTGTAAIAESIDAGAARAALDGHGGEFLSSGAGVD